MEKISKFIFNMDISQRSIQRIIYNEIKPLNRIDIESQDTKFDSHMDPGEQKEEITIIDKNKKISLYDELKLANRFKEEEIKCIINTIEKKVKELGNKYFITLSKNIEYKRANNTIKIIIELKENN